MNVDSELFFNLTSFAASLGSIPVTLRPNTEIAVVNV